MQTPATVAAKPDAFIPTRRTLLSRLRNWEDHESWVEFVNIYRQFIHRAALKTGLPEVVAQEVVQETLISVAKQMPGFRYDPALGSFKSWLMAITRRRITDQLRQFARNPARANAKPAEVSTEISVDNLPAPDGPDLAEILEQQWRQQLFDQALAMVRARVAPRQFQVFDCCVLKGWPMDDVVRALNVTAGQAYVTKHRVSALLKKQVEQLEKALA